MQTLRWVGHESEVLKKVAEFYRNEIYTDCTFLVEGQYLRGHKPILCACSPFFQELFKSELGNKTISLENVKFSDLKSIFKYIYFGEVDVPFSQITTFLNTFNLLGLKGLEEFFNTENIDGLAEATGALPSSAYSDGSSLVIKSEVQQEESNETTESIKFYEEEFLIAEDREEYSDLNENANVLSVCDLKCESGMDIVEPSTPALSLAQHIENRDVNSIEIKVEMPEEDNGRRKGQVEECLRSKGKKDDLDFNDDAVFHHEVDLKSEGIDPDESTTVLLSHSEKQSDEHSRAVPSKRNLKSRLRSSNGSHTFRHGSATFSRKKNLDADQPRHTGERRFTCIKCSASFAQVRGLVVHQRKHTGERSFACYKCTASFTTKQNLVTHKQKHAGERPFTCDKCSASYTRKEHLVRHYLKHTGERPFTCNKCTASFTTNQNLLTHKRKHTGERPFTCAECSSSFTQKGHLVRHQLKHTGERPFTCD